MKSNFIITLQLIYFVLFKGHYGDVLRVKILFNKKDTALIQFADAQQASTGIFFAIVLSA